MFGIKEQTMKIVACVYWSPCTLRYVWSNTMPSERHYDLQVYVWKDGKEYGELTRLDPSLK
jgi:hypothetical protein